MGCASDPDGTSDAGIPTPEPRRFGNYLLLNELGRDAQGVVFLAEEVALRRKVALEMLTGAGASSQITRE
ncbi:MAG: hypothetical protein SGI72_17300 [Planctomycetota bacterium]|nr:hypothetical protein [Planctomycetota bacterium]